MLNSKVSNNNESMPTDVVAVEFNQKKLKKANSLKTFEVHAVCPRESDQVSIRVFNVVAPNVRDAKKIAYNLLSRLEDEEVQAITFDAYLIGLGPEPDCVLDIINVDSDPLLHSWTREETETGDLSEVVKKVAQGVVKKMWDEACSGLRS